MLKILQFGEEYREPCVLLLGAFDGLHLGHRELLSAARVPGLPVGITSIYGGKGSVLFTQEERRTIFERAGIDFVCEISFTDALKQTSAEDFLRQLSSSIAAKAVVCGEDFRFGKDAQGTPELLERYFRAIVVNGTVRSPERLIAWGFPVDQKVSTAICKELLQDGKRLYRLNECLLDAQRNLFASGYFIEGKVRHGREVGRTYGFPTLNLSVAPEKLLPEDGVYGGYAETPKGTYKTIINIGACPTFGVTERKVEAYLDGFSGDLYGETVRIYPTVHFRDIEKFSSAETLKEQLQTDIQKLRTCL